MLTPLWTDYLLFLLLFMASGFAIYASRHEHLRIPWRHVATSRLGMAAGVILAVYIVIAILDSMHFRARIEDDSQGNRRYSTEIVSVLDVLLKPITERTERTYSAPFALYSYAKEAIEQPDGTQIRDYARLAWAGSHLEVPEQKSRDILLRSLKAVVIAGGVWLLVSALVIRVLANKWCCTFSKALTRIRSRQSAVPWDVILATLGVVLVLIGLAVELSIKYHIFGTDKVGQDVFVQAVKSIRTGILIGTLTTLVMLPFALLLGIMAGYFGGWIDDVIQYLYTTLSSIPGVLLIAAAVLMLHVYMENNAEQFQSVTARADIRLLFLCMILGVTSWTGLCRFLRGEALKLRAIDYVQAAQAFGVKNSRILSRHLLPNVMHIVMISVVLDFSGLVLAEAVLSYINIGVDPSMNSWGNMINSARLEMAREPIVWWSLLAAFVFMFALVLSANLFSDAVRDAFDPRLRELKTA